jgi:(E)-4-hydroxy-3-methylbut-2-enyl-diphosphate synthase
MDKNNILYCNSLTEYSRFKTKEVFVGDVPLGGNNPIRIQSMTTTDTMDTIATVEQSIRMIEAGCEYVRITAPSKNEAENLLNIKNELRKRGYKAPLIADIHFTPNAAEIAARIVEKVRINPGNFADKKRFDQIDYSDDEYNAEIERIRTRFTPLVKICKEYGTALRIGTNHGSLSDRIMSRYGDTPLGMVESAMEFLRICEDENFYNIVLSMKSSNPQVMVQAYRLLVMEMKKAGMNYPLHLGVTEAGNGEDGRIKSAMGIGTLLEDGLGDTIRVSLTEDPECEIPPAKILARRYNNRSNHKAIMNAGNISYSPVEYSKRFTSKILNLGNDFVPVVIADYSDTTLDSPAQLKSIGYEYDSASNKWSVSDMAADFIYTGEMAPGFEVPEELNIIMDYEIWKSYKNDHHFPFLSFQIYKQEYGRINSKVKFIEAGAEEITQEFLEFIKRDSLCILVLKSSNKHWYPSVRRAFIELQNSNIKLPVIIKRTYPTDERDKFIMFSSIDMGSLLLDGFGDGIWITPESKKSPDNSDKKAIEPVNKFINRISFGILQAARTRITKTEYIACPSCGRTLFDLQSTTARIKEKTEHLKGIKIAIMGCIVNGPGEMADADFGYVGSGPGKISLYKGKTVIKKNIPETEAVEELLQLIENSRH